MIRELEKNPTIQNIKDYLKFTATDVDSLSTNFYNLSLEQTTQFLKLIGLSTNVDSLSTDFYNSLTNLSTNIDSLSTNINNNYLPLSGGTLTGPVNKLSDNFTSAYNVSFNDSSYINNSLTSSVWYDILKVSDKDGNRVNLIRDIIYPNGTVEVQYSIAAINQSDSSTIWHGFTLTATSTGTKTVSFNDPEAWRTGLNAVNKAGDTMTGPIYIKDNRFICGSSITTNVWKLASGLRDVNDNFVGYVQYNQTAEGVNSLQLTVKNKPNSTTTTNFEHSIYIRSGIDGTRSVGFSHPEAWRTGLNVVNKAGDTMTGTLNIKDTRFNINATSVSSNLYKVLIGLQDTNNNYTCYVQASQTQDGTSKLQLAARGKNTSGTQIDNGITFNVTKSGQRTIDVSDATAWRNALGIGNSGAWPIPIEQGGTGATTRLDAAKNLTREDVGANATYFVTMTGNWGKFGYSSNANVLSALGLSDTGWKTAVMTTNNATGTIYYRRIGPIVTFMCYDFTLAADLTNYYTIATYDTSYIGKVNAFGVAMQHNNAENMIKININTSGNIITYKNGIDIASGTKFSFCITFMQS